jgi:hypothetical protein
MLDSPIGFVAKERLTQHLHDDRILYESHPGVRVLFDCVNKSPILKDKLTL